MSSFLTDTFPLSSDVQTEPMLGISEENDQPNGDSPLKNNS